MTGRPFTLFRNNNIYDSGAVGIALRRSRKSVIYDFPTNVSFLGMTPISKPMTVTQYVTQIVFYVYEILEGLLSRCEGNMIISLDDQNPTQLLLSCIRESGLETDSTGHLKDNSRFAFGVVENGVVSSLSRLKTQKLNRDASWAKCLT